MFATLAFLFVGVTTPASATELGPRPSPATRPPATIEAPARPKPERTTHTIVVVSDWFDERDEAWRDARRKAYETAFGPYRIVGSSVAVKGGQRRVKLRIEWRE